MVDYNLCQMEIVFSELTMSQTDKDVSTVCNLDVIHSLYFTELSRGVTTSVVFATHRT